MAEKIKKDFNSSTMNLDVHEMKAWNMATDEWSTEVGMTPDLGSIEYESGDKMYKVTIRSNITSHSPGIMDFDDDFLPQPGRGRIKPPPVYQSQSFDAVGVFDIDMEEDQIIKQKIKIREKSSWGKRDPWTKY